MCCFREAKNYERFGAITQSIVLMAIKQLRELKDELPSKLKSDINVDAAEKDSCEYHNNLGDELLLFNPLHNFCILFCSCNLGFRPPAEH